MNYRCQCPKPAYAYVPLYKNHQGCKVQVFDKNVLHFKKADRECNRCGQPLCKDCAEEVVNWEFIPGEGMKGTIDYCPICSEDIKEVLPGSVIENKDFFITITP